MSNSSFPPRAFTLKFDQLRNVLVTEIEIFIPNTHTSVKAHAIWDTGASSTAIAKTVAAKLGLIPTGKVQVHTANGTVWQNTYIVHVGLPNKVQVGNVTVTEVDALSGGCEVLIGMDIIINGDFAITNFEGKTMMSFRIPSMHHMDYVNQISNSQKLPLKQTIGRNDPCPCGSGKKYKHCHDKT